MLRRGWCNNCNVMTKEDWSFFCVDCVRAFTMGLSTAIAAAIVSWLTLRLRG